MLLADLLTSGPVVLPVLASIVAIYIAGGVMHGKRKR